MFTFSPNDNRVSDKSSSGSLKDRSFGGNRKVTENVQKAEDYTKPSLERRANMAEDVEEKIFNPVEETTKDVDDMVDNPGVDPNDPTKLVTGKKREVSRRAETSTVGAANEYRRPGDGDDKIYSDPDNRPEGEHREDDVVAVPDPNKKHGSRNPFRIGEDYDKRGDQNTGHTTKPR
jgi:hypothetical protein